MSVSYPKPPRPTEATAAGIGLIVGGGINTLVSAIAVVSALIDSVSYHEPPGLSVLPIVGIPGGALAGVAGILLLLGRNKPLVYVGAIAALVPSTLCCVLGAAFGVLTLVLLPRPQIRAHFGEPVPPAPLQ